MSTIAVSKRLSTNLNSFRKSDANREMSTLAKEMKRILNDKIYGFSFSPYHEGQHPTLESNITVEQIRTRMEIIAPHTEWVRTFSCTDGNENIPAIAHEFGIKTLVGAWICDDMEKNREELDSLIQVAQAGHVDMIAIGNEVMLREELETHQILAYIAEVKEACPGIPVSYVDAYYVFREYPEIVEAIDVILANCYPFWEYCDVDHAVDYMRSMYNLTVQVADGKPVIISETGWPNHGDALGAAQPGKHNAMRYFVETYEWAEQEDVDIFYFSSFDESWKIDAEGSCGAHWGIWDKNNQYKYDD